MVPKFQTICLLFAFSFQISAATFQDAVTELELDELLEITDVSVLGQAGVNLTSSERQAAAVLLDAGVIDAIDLKDIEYAKQKTADFLDVVQAEHPGLLGRIGDASVFLQLQRMLDHEGLLSDRAFVDALHGALAKGILTGYDLRVRSVYDGFPEGQYFIYSHSNLKHVQQLTTLLHREGVDGWIYLVPKVSAFLFRDDWGEPGENVVSLPDGRLVMQGREMAVLFRFDAADGRQRFHDLVTRYAKKDSADEPGLIKHAWWQPFYYTDEPLQGFRKISLVILSRDELEATLTVLEERTEEVVKALEGNEKDWQLRVDSVWVNPPFFRFLNGGFK